MTEALRAIALADDFEIVRIFEFFSSEISRMGPIALDELEAHIDVPEHEAVLEELKRREASDLTGASSVSVARWLMATAAQREDLAGLVAHCARNWEDDKKTVGKMLAAGLVGAVLLMVATTSFEYKGERLVVAKQPLPMDDVSFVFEGFKQRLEFHSSGGPAEVDSADGEG